MSNALRRCCEIIYLAFERAYAVLDTKNVKACIEIKIMTYRNYNSPWDELIDSTAFETTAVNLKRFLDSVQPKIWMGK
jgi:hypothetical protein